MISSRFNNTFLQRQTLVNLSQEENNILIDVTNKEIKLIIFKFPKEKPRVTLLCW